MTQKIIWNYEAYLRNTSRDGKRNVVFAYKKLPVKPYHANYTFNLHEDGYDFGMTNFTLLGILSLKCELRENITKMIKEIRLSEIKLIVMYIHFL
jgi:magnesium-transporting ATPase (P-type)